MKNHNLPNPFDWSQYNKRSTQEAIKHIMGNPFNCADCGDTYNKDDLIKHFGTKYLICKN